MKVFFKKKLSGEKSLTLYVVFSISILLAYTAICLIFPERANDTLTTCMFSAFGGEILFCALIKIFKLKRTE